MGSTWPVRIMELKSNRPLVAGADQADADAVVGADHIANGRARRKGQAGNTERRGFVEIPARHFG